MCQILTPLYDLTDTICALATPQGEGAIGVIRISGKETFNIVQKVFKGKNVSAQLPNTIHFGKIMDNNTVIDEVLVSLFKAPKSYTGEDIIEISCHGSSYILKKILDILIRNGARMAQRGEFTLRAFLNGKLNLSQAEAVADIIASENEMQHKVAMEQMRGGYQNDLQQLREKLIHFAALIELELDFSEEDVEFANRNQLSGLLYDIEKKVRELKNSFEFGNAIKTGIYTVIAGRPNAGKSTLLNTLLNENRAIVSDIAGTTRDTIEESIVLEGIKFRFIDTAGIRKNTQDRIEEIGIQKTFENIQKAKILLYVFDIHELSPKQIKEDIEAIPMQDNIKIILLANKIDTLSSEEINTQKHHIVKEFGLKPNTTIIEISAKMGQNIEDIKQTLIHYSGKKNMQESSIVTNVRHVEALDKTLQAIHKVQNAIQDHVSSDLLAEDLRQSLRFLGEITGQVDVDKDILGTIFSKFCIGK